MMFIPAYLSCWLSFSSLLIIDFTDLSVQRYLRTLYFLFFRFLNFYRMSSHVAQKPYSPCYDHSIIILRSYPIIFDHAVCQDRTMATMFRSMMIVREPMNSRLKIKIQDNSICKQTRCRETLCCIFWIASKHRANQNNHSCDV